MRFSIRDLLWLMAVVALAATVYADRVQMQREAARWAAQKQQLEEASAQALAAMKARADGLRMQNALLQHQLVVQLERARQREDDAPHAVPAAVSLPSRRAAPRPIPALPIAAELQP